MVQVSSLLIIIYNGKLMHKLLEMGKKIQHEIVISLTILDIGMIVNHVHY